MAGMVPKLSVPQVTVKDGNAAEHDIHPRIKTAPEGRIYIS